MTTRHRDAAGRVVEVTTGEPEWTEDDQVHALALTAYEAGLCPGCKRSLAQTTDPLMEGRYAYDGFVECFYCLALAKGADSVSKDHPHPHALMHEMKTLRPREKRLGEA